MIVELKDCAGKIGSGELDVFSTPAMLALAEKTSWMSIADELGEGEGTVGIKVILNHRAATPVGQKVWCETELIEIDRKRLVFRFEVSDGSGPVGDGIHERFIINNDRFMAKANEKS